MESYLLTLFGGWSFCIKKSKNCDAVLLWNWDNGGEAWDSKSSDNLLSDKICAGEGGIYVAWRADCCWEIVAWDCKLSDNFMFVEIGAGAEGKHVVWGWEWSCCCFEGESRNCKLSNNFMFGEIKADDISKLVLAGENDVVAHCLAFLQSFFQTFWK